MTHHSTKRNRAWLLAMLILTALLTGCADDKAAAPVEQLILDCDMGYMNDDMLALSLLLQAEKEGGFAIAGITLEGGNVFIDAEFESEGALQTGGWENTYAFLKAVDRLDIPVYRGTDYPIGYDGSSLWKLTEYFETAEYLPYCDGYGAIHAFENTVSGSLCDSEEAADFLIDCAKKNPGNVVILAIGPTMNIAHAIERDPSFAGNVKAIYYMGGAVGASYETETIRGKKVNAIAGANVTPYAEYNVLYDPSAFDKCITAGFPQQFLLPAELSVDCDSRVRDELKNRDGKMAQLWYTHYEEALPEYPYWDPLTAFVYLRPACAVSAGESYLTVNTHRDDERFGETTLLDADGYNALSEQEQARYGKITLIRSVQSFWEEAIRLLCREN